MKDTITILTAKKGIKMTKVFDGDTVETYGSGRYFKPQSVIIKDLKGLSGVLTKLAGMPSRCVIRGTFNGEKNAATIDGGVDPKAKGFFARQKKLYDDVPHHWVMLDVDDFKVDDFEPAKQPVKAVERYIEEVLPEEFQGRSFYWQLSASAGQPNAKHKLKAHIWFWLETAYDSVQMTAWAKSVSQLIDVAPLRTVQVHYTADPLFKGETTDSVKVRSGLVEGYLGEAVDLTIDESVLASADQYSGEGSDYEFIDPTQKTGIIGAFHRAYTIEEILDDVLPEQFSFDGDGAEDGRRVTWHDGGGTAGGCFVTEDRMHFGSTHNTDPFDNRVVNLFDLVRYYKYGDLDEGVDPFILLDMASRPSYQAMLDEFGEDERVIAELGEMQSEDAIESISSRDELLDQIQAAESEKALLGEVCVSIRTLASTLEPVDVEVLAKALQAKILTLTDTKPPISVARDLLKAPKHTVTAPRGVPNWAAGYVFVEADNVIYEYATGASLSQGPFEFRHNAHAGTDFNGNQLSAWSLLKDNHHMPKAYKGLYMPHLNATFTLEDLHYVNTYRPNSVPEAKPKKTWNRADKRAVKRAARHLELLCNERPEVYLALLDWLAFCVQFPGQKVAYTWLIVGGEGVGKTWIAALMSAAMGARNVRTVNTSEVTNETFNGWAEGHCFAAIEEIRMHGHKQDAWENLKAPLANPSVVIVKKGVDGYETPNITNYILFSNHHDAIPVTLGSRRVGVVHSPIDGPDTASLLETMAMSEGCVDSGEYFNELFGAIENHGGALREWLVTYQIRPSFNAKGRAPITDEMRSMALGNLSHLEEMVADVIEQGGPWVTKEVVSPLKLQALVELWEDGGEHIIVEKLAHYLRKLGYKKYDKRVKIGGKAYRFWVGKGLNCHGSAEMNDKIRDIVTKSEESEQGGTPDEDFLK